MHSRTRSGLKLLPDQSAILVTISFQPAPEDEVLMLDGSTETKYGELEVDVLCSVLNCRSILAKDVDSQRYDHS